MAADWCAWEEGEVPGAKLGVLYRGLARLSLAGRVAGSLGKGRGLRVGWVCVLELFCVFF